MRDAPFTIPTPALLSRVVDMLDHVPMQDRDTNGDLYEYLLSKIASAGVNGQFRTPRHIIQLMVEMTAPGPEDQICDPACGTAGSSSPLGSTSATMTRASWSTPISENTSTTTCSTVSTSTQPCCGSAQIHFVRLIIQHLTENGLMQAERLYESPFTDAAPLGPDALFPSADVDNIIAILKTVHANASPETTVA